MTAITTVAELNALPVGKDVKDLNHDVWRKQPDGRWLMPYDDRHDAKPLSSETLRYLYGPLWLPAVAAPVRVMTRCVSDGCQSSHALPPGSSYACPDHSNHTAAGGSR